MGLDPEFKKDIKNSVNDSLDEKFEQFTKSLRIVGTELIQDVDDSLNHQSKYIDERLKYHTEVIQSAISGNEQQDKQQNENFLAILSKALDEQQSNAQKLIELNDKLFSEQQEPEQIDSTSQGRGLSGDYYSPPQSEQQTEEKQQSKKTPAQKLSNMRDNMMEMLIKIKNELGPKGKISQLIGVVSAPLKLISKGVEGIVETTAFIGRMVNRFVDGVFNIAGKVALATVGILAFIGWFNDAGPHGFKATMKGLQQGIEKIVHKVMTSIKDEILDEIVPGRKKKGKDFNTKEDRNVIAPSIDKSVKNKDEFKGYLQQNRGSFTGVSGVDKVGSSGPNNLGEISSTYEVKTGQNTPILAPIQGVIKNFNSKKATKNGVERLYFDFLLHAGPTRIKFENVINPRVYNELQVVENQILGFSDGSFKMTVLASNKDNTQLKKNEELINNYASQVNQQKDKKFNESLYIHDKRWKDKDQKKLNEALTTSVLNNHAQNRGKDAKADGLTNAGNRIYNDHKLKDDKEKEKMLKSIVNGDEYNIGDKTPVTPEQDKQEFDKATAPETPAPKAEINKGNESSKTAAEQNEDLKKANNDLLKTPQPTSVGETQTPVQNVAVTSPIPNGDMELPNVFDSATALVALDNPLKAI